jgi:hypothetical protein
LSGRRGFAELKLAFDESHEQFHVEGEPAPTNWEVAAVVAYEDFAAHPDRWKYNPYESPRAAARRVWMAVKPLLSAVSETRAA